MILAIFGKIQILIVLGLEKDIVKINKKSRHSMSVIS
jgi:hypothetical protein